MQLQIPQNSASAPAQSAVEQVNPSQQFGHVLEQQSGRTAIPEAPQIFDTGAIIGRGLESLNNVVQDIAVKAKAIKSAEEHSRLQNDLIDVQMETQEARKLAAANKAELGLSNDDFEVEYRNRVQAIIEKRPLDSYSDPDIRRAAQTSYKSFQANDALDFEQRVAIPARVSKIKSDTDGTVQRALSFIENNPDTTAEKVDEMKSQLSGLYDNPAVIATLGTEVARAGKAMMMAKVDGQLVKNIIEGADWKGVEGSYDMEEANAKALKISEAGEAAIRSRPSLTADQIDAATKHLEKKIHASLTQTQHNVNARQKQELIVSQFETQNKTTGIIHGLSNGDAVGGKATTWLEELSMRSSKAYAAGNIPQANLLDRQVEQVQNAISQARTRQAAAWERQVEKMKPLIEAKQEIAAGRTITDPRHANALYEEATATIPYMDSNARLKAMLPIAGQLNVIPEGLARDIRGSTYSKDKVIAQKGFERVDALLSQNPALKNRLDEVTQRDYEAWKLGTPIDGIVSKRDAAASIPKDVLDSRQTTFRKLNITDPKSPRASTVAQAIAQKIGVKIGDIPDTHLYAVTAEAEHQYQLNGGDMPAAVNVATSKMLQLNPDAQYAVYGKSSYGPRGRMVANPPELRIADQEGFKHQLNYQLSGYKDPEGKRAPIKEGEYLLEWKGSVNGQPVYKVLTNDPLTGLMINHVDDFAYDPAVAKKMRDDESLRNFEKNRAARAEEIAAQKKASESSLKFDAEVAAKKVVESNRTAAPAATPKAAPKRKSLLESDDVLPFRK